MASAFIVTATILPGVFARPAAAVDSLGSVTILQSNPANPSQAFRYTANVPEMSSEFYLDQDPTTYPEWSETSTWVTPGQFEVQQDEPPLGWDIADISCTDPEGNSTGDVSNRRAQITMDSNEEIVCTFTMAQAVGDINIFQSTVPQHPTSFQYGGDLGSFSLSDDGDEVNDGTWRNQGFSGLWEGTYEITQSPIDGWDLTYLDCNDPDGGTLLDQSAGKVIIDLDGGESIDCTFTNQSAEPRPPSGAIRIILDAVPDDPVDVPFTGTESPFSLDDDPADGALDRQIDFWAHELGSTTFVAALPAGFQLKDLTCTDPDNGTTVDKATATATVDLDNDEEVDCTFTIEPKPVAPPPPTPTCNGLEATIVGTPGATTIRGTAGNDVIVDLDGANRIDGRGGDDTICTGHADDVINGGAGNDWIFPGAGRNNVDGGTGADVIAALVGDDTISGGAGNDELSAGDGNNSVSGGSGNDLIRAGDGNDRIDGGKDFDTCLPGLGSNTVRNCEA